MQNYNQNKVIYDWFSLTSKIHDVQGMIEEIGMQRSAWLTLTGVRGYAWRQHCNSVSVHYGKRPEVWLEMSGSGCRAFEDLGHGDFEHLFDLYRENPEEINLTRIDVAFDDFEGVLSMEQLFLDTYFRREYISKACKTTSELSQFVSDPDLDGKTIVFGAPKSEILIRIYDKRAERLGILKTKAEKEEFKKNVSHWVRVELQLRDERAKQWAKQIGERKLTIGEMFSGVLRNYLRFVERPIGSSDENRWRWPMKPYWAELISQAEAIKLYEKPGMEYNLQRLDRLTTYQVGNAVDTAIKIHGVKGFMELLEANRPPKLNSKYDMLLKQHGKFEDREDYLRSLYSDKDLRSKRQESIDDPNGAWEWSDGDDDLHVDPDRERRILKARADMDDLHREVVRKNDFRRRAQERARQRNSHKK